MTKNEVMAMTDEELRIKAAELMGAKWYLFDGTTNPKFRVLEFPTMWLSGYTPPLAVGTEPMGESALRNIRDYPHDIAAAWQLVEMLRGHGFYPEVENVGIGGHLWNVWCMIPPNGGDADLIGQDKDAPRAITRAFILAMESVPQATKGDG